MTALQRAATLLHGTIFDLDRAHVLAELGGLERRAAQVKSARAHLREAMSLAVGCGAEGLVEAARAELVASGARPRRPRTTGVDALTAAERRVCLLAANGGTNRDIAQELFVTVKTVELHLTNSYRKLGIRSRRQLRGALDGPVSD